MLPVISHLCLTQLRHSHAHEGEPDKPDSPEVSRSYFFLSGRCVRAEAAADFSALLDFGFRSTLDAAEAAFALVTSLLDFAISITSFLPRCAFPARGDA